MRTPYAQIFTINADGSVSPKATVKVGPVTMSPGTSFTRGVAFGGLDIAAISGHDLDVEYEGTTPVIKGYFQ